MGNGETLIAPWIKFQTKRILITSASFRLQPSAVLQMNRTLFDFDSWQSAIVSKITLESKLFPVEP